MANELIIEITPEGIKIEAAGFTGGACLAELDEFRKMLAELGIETDVSDQQLKREAMLASGEGAEQRRLVRRGD